MKIVEKSSEIVLFENLKSGECFSFKGALYMKVSADSSICPFNTVHLRCGSVTRLGDKVHVKRVDCELLCFSEM